MPRTLSCTQVEEPGPHQNPEMMPPELLAALALVNRACASVVCELAEEPDDLESTALQVAASVGVAHNLLPALAHLRNELATKAEASRRDNTPAVLTHDLTGHVAQLEQVHATILQALPSVYALNIHGAPPAFGQQVARALRDALELPFASTPDLPLFDALLQLHATLKATALTLLKVCADVRQLASIDHAPKQCEALSMVCRQVIEHDAVLSQEPTHATAQRLARHLLQSIRLLTDATTLFTGELAHGTAVQPERSANGLANSLMLATHAHASSPN